MSFSKKAVVTAGMLASIGVYSLAGASPAMADGTFEIRSPNGQKTTLGYHEAPPSAEEVAAHQELEIARYWMKEYERMKADSDAWGDRCGWAGAAGAGNEAAKVVHKKTFGSSGIFGKLSGRVFAPAGLLCAQAWFIGKDDAENLQRWTEKHDRAKAHLASFPVRDKVCE